MARCTDIGTFKNVIYLLTLVSKKVTLCLSDSSPRGRGQNSSHSSSSIKVNATTSGISHVASRRILSQRRKSWRISRNSALLRRQRKETSICSRSTDAARSSTTSNGSLSKQNSSAILLEENFLTPPTASSMARSRKGLNSRQATSIFSSSRRCARTTLSSSYSGSSDKPAGRSTIFFGMNRRSRSEQKRDTTFCVPSKSDRLSC